MDVDNGEVCLVFALNVEEFITSQYRGSKIQAPPMVYISGEEMTHYAMNLIMDNWIKYLFWMLAYIFLHCFVIVRPNVDVSKWEFFDLSCR